MFGSTVIGVAIGLIFVFFVFSMVVSGVNEAISRALGLRSRNLWRSIHELIDTNPQHLTDRPDPRSLGGDRRPVVGGTATSWTERVYAHPIISQVDRTRRSAHTRIRAIEPNDFARSLIGAIVPDEDGTTTIADVRDAVGQLDDNVVFKRPLLTLIAEAEGSLNRLREGVGGWFDANMEQLSARYKRNARWAMFAIGLAVVVSFNVDAISAAESLYRDDALREAVIRTAQDITTTCEQADAAARVECAKGLVDDIDTLDDALLLPVGWTEGQSDVDGLRFLGWIIAAAAVAQGGQFWFDTLRKVSSLRR